MSNHYKHWNNPSLKHCRWCGIAYTARKPIGKDGFCSPKCKQAHYRAYKSYVTQRAAARSGPAKRRVTQKSKKKR